VIYALALGAVQRGSHYLAEYPGWRGVLLLCAAQVSVILGGARIFDALRYEEKRSWIDGQ